MKELLDEGAVQMLRVRGDDGSGTPLLAAVGQLQFEVVVFRLKDEYKVDCIYESVSVQTARWVECVDDKMLEEFRRKGHDNLAVDGGGLLTYLAPSRVNLSLTEERWPDIRFRATREH